MFHQIKLIKKFVLDLIFPEFCSGCKKEGDILCESCLKELRKSFIFPKCFCCGARVPAGQRTPAGRTCLSCRKNTNIYAFFSSFPYSNEIVKTLIHKLKYNRIHKIAIILGDELSEYFLKMSLKIPADSLIIPIPLHKNKYRKRGFNQSEVIAESLSKNLKIPILAGLKKIKLTPDQTELSGAKRRKNVKGAFLAINWRQIKGKNIILVDDVKTTGSTLEEAAKTLKKAGAKRIWALTIAS